MPILAAVILAAAVLPFTPPGLGAAAPRLVGATVDGGTLDTQALRGKVVVLNFFATWCPPCRAETNDLITAYRKLHGANVEFVGVDTTETAPIVRSFNGANGVPFPSVVAPAGAYDAYGIAFIPTTIVLDRAGTIRARWVGGVAPDQLAQYVWGAREQRSVTFISAAQRTIDADLAPGKYRFDGDDAARASALAALDAAVARATKLEDDDRNRVDHERMQREIGELQVQAGAAVQRSAGDDAQRRRGLVLSAQGYARLNRFGDALAAYQTAAQAAPDDPQLAAAVARSYYRLHDYPRMIDAQQRVVALTPQDGDAWSFLGLGYQRARRFAQAVPAYDRALTLLKAAAAGDHPGQLALADVADTALDLANVHVALGRTADARRTFALANRFAASLDPRGPYADLKRNVVERTQEGTIALALGHRDGKTALAVAPWTGPDLPGSLASTLKYRLVVAGPPNGLVRLKASGLRRDWVASFCADGLCSPQAVAFRVPATGVKTFEFQLVAPNPGEPPGRVAIRAGDGALADVPVR